MFKKWKAVDVESPTDDGTFVSLPGLPNATKRMRTWQWQLFDVDFSEIPEDTAQGYHVYFAAGTYVARTKKWIETSQFMARLGPGNVTFWAAHSGRHHYEPLPIKHLPPDSDGKWSQEAAPRISARQAMRLSGITAV